jgi:phosphoenolpyruvate carboxykinase (ATP)
VFYLKEFATALEGIENSARLLYLSKNELKERALKEGRKTEFGNLSHVSKVRSRSAKFTKNTIDDKITDGDKETLSKVVEYLKGKNLVCAKRLMGEKIKTICRLVVTEPYCHILYAWGELLNDAEQEQKPDLTTVMLPEWEERKILVDTDTGITFALGTDYIGEAKKSFLRKWMKRVKNKTCLGLHAGSKSVRLRDPETGEVVEKGQIYLGLSATGKTTLTCHSFFLEEGIKLYQDDVGALLSDGSFIGTEGRGMFIKTDGLNPKDQPDLYSAVTTRNAILENVWVDENGHVDFYKTDLTSNGRAVILRSDMKIASDSIDLKKIDQIFFLTRNLLAPAVAKLEPETAAAFFMLGESVESSAGDPSKAGQAIRVVGTNPFIVGSRGEEGNVFYDILKKNPDIECYILNTGKIGKDRIDITVRDTINIILAITRGNIEWVKDPDWNYMIPKKIRGVESAKFRPREFYEESEYKELVEKMREDRLNWLRQFKDLNPEIVGSL